MLQGFNLSELPATPWKNGGGSTREIACWPPGAGFDDFLWRASIASIASDGPFSRFIGVDRVITLLDGSGVHLHGDGVDHRLDRPLVPFGFSGDLQIASTMLGGPSSDFNVMSRRGRLRATLRVLHAHTTLQAAPHGLLLAWRGAWRAGEQALAAGQGLWWADAPHAWTLAPQASADAALLAVQWQPETDKETA